MHAIIVPYIHTYVHDTEAAKSGYDAETRFNCALYLLDGPFTLRVTDSTNSEEVALMTKQHNFVGGLVTKHYYSAFKWSLMIFISVFCNRAFMTAVLQPL